MTGTPHPPSPAPPAPPNVVAALPQYDVGGQIGRGGMGVVYAAVHRPLGRPVAVKRLPGVLAEDARMSARFEHEARLLAHLDHPHIVPVYDYVQDRGEHLLVMEKLDGGTVWSKFTTEGVTPAQSCAFGLAMLAGLHAAHGAGVLHLDVKPKNLLFTAGGVLKVADFGISQVVSEGATLVTHGGQVLGTPAYLSPEQALGNPLTPAADVYGAGTVLYELLSGRLPFDTGGGPLAMIQRHVYHEPRPLTEVPDPLAGVVMRSIERDPRSRYRNAETFAADLAQAAADLLGRDWLLRLTTPVHLTPHVATAANRPPLPAGATHPTRPVPRESLELPVRALRDTRPTPAAPARPGTHPPVPAAQVPARPAPARWFALAAALAAVLLVSLPLTLPTRTLPVLTADLSKPVPAPIDPGTAPDTRTPTRLTLTAAGITLADVPADPNASSPVFELPGAGRWIIGGAVVAAVTAGGETREYSLQPTTHPLISLMGAGGVLLLLFTLAYLESALRALRRRRAGAAAVVVAAPSGFGAGVAVWLLASVLLRHAPELWQAVLCGGVGVVAAVCAAVATRRAAVSR
ncbi:protein kinase [Saccharothrix longispora]|uniref:non-specific serine/threonine protein kinase n=1 Tax=Saccharothrix longispora TaxID=33920 RepID=A0ABU1PZ29_9PSEU|nr:protein kinase [Saccharothrix longispora]MDR6595404.1 serine/threonine-protein kinase [Saccharothrix longispora]